MAYLYLLKDAEQAMKAGKYEYNGRKYFDMKDVYWQVVQETDMNRAYFNWEQFKIDFPLLKVRSAYMTGLSTSIRVPVKVPTITNGYFPVFEATRWIAGKRIIDYIKSQPISLRKYVKSLGIERELSALSKMTAQPVLGEPDMFKRPERPLALKLESIESICNDMGISCHELLFGAKCDITLPLPLASIINQVEKLPSSSASKVVSSITRKANNAYSSLTEPVSYANLFQKRVTDRTIKDIGVSKRFVFDDTPTSTLRDAIKSVNGEERSMPILSTLQSLAYEMNTGIDFFFAHNYISNSRVVYRTEDMKKRTVPKKYHQFIRHMEDLPAETYMEVLTQCLTEVLKANSAFH